MKKGFTLVEIMIVVAIIALLAALAIPNLLRARIQANESSAIASLRTLSSGMESYRVSNPDYTGATLAVLSQANPSYIDAVLGSGSKAGYNFALNVVGASQYWISADPITPNSTGVRSFYISEQGVICAGNAAAGGHAGAASCPGGFNPVE